VQDLAGLLDCASEDREDALPDLGQLFTTLPQMGDSLSHTDPKHGYLAAEMTDRVFAEARIGFGVARPRTYNKLRWFLLDKLMKRDLIIAVDRNIGAFENEILVHIPRERIVIVDQDEVGGSRERRSG